MGGPVGGAFSDLSKKSRIGGSNRSAAALGFGGSAATGDPATGAITGLLFRKKFSPLDPLQIGPSLFDDPEVPEAPAAPAPPDESKAILRTLSEARMNREMRRGQGRSGAFQSRTRNTTSMAGV